MFRPSTDIMEAERAPPELVSFVLHGQQSSPSLEAHFIHEAMRDRMERLPTFPFSVGCVSKSSVDVVDRELKNSLAETNPPPSQIQLSNGRMKSSLNLPLPKPNISAGIQKVIKGFKSLSYLFQFRKEDDDDGDEEEEIEMEIGFPTDVQHVAHIGWDGFNNSITGSNTSMKRWDKGPDLLSLPAISLRQFELAMAAQTGCPH